MTQLGRRHQLGDGVDGGLPDDDAAFELFNRAAEVGDAAAHAELGFIHGVGWGGREIDVPRALLHHYFAALGGDPRGQMALAHRHARGVGVPKSCRAAALYYNPAAENVVESVDAAVPGISPSVEKHRLRRVVCTVVYEYARVSPAFLPASTQL